MSEPQPDKPDGWQRPGRRERRLGVWVVVIAVVLFFGVGLVACVAAMATYG